MELEKYKEAKKIIDSKAELEEDSKHLSLFIQDLEGDIKHNTKAYLNLKNRINRNITLNLSEEDLLVIKAVLKNIYVKQEREIEVLKHKLEML